jgi:flagellar hook protein FlgE
MSLFGSLFSGVSGLAAQSQSMGMISDNVSNVNTTAYKGAVAQFSNLVTRSSAAAAYTPGGVRAGTLYRIGNQGLIQNSESPTDVALDGRGFFVVNPRPDGSGEQLYTRAGSFRPDFLGNMRNAAGFYLQGWALDAEGGIVDINRLETVNVRVSGTARATTQIEIGANLDASEAPFLDPYAGGDMAAFHNGGVGVEPHFSRAIQVFDSLGSAHNLTLAFLKDPAANTWRVELFGEAGELDAAHPDGLLAAGQVEFNGNGTLAAIDLTPVLPGGAVAGDPITVDWANGAMDNELALDLGVIGEAIGLTQFDSPYSVAYTSQDGAGVGELSGVSIDENGFVIASFTNGQERRIFKLPVATFANPVALDPRSGNVFAQTDGSGTFNLREAGRGGAGKISPSSLEAANVDLADEFTKLIVTQRAYSANARIISTTDEMLDEVIRLKR